MKDKNTLKNIIQTAFLPVATYYFVHQIAAFILLGILVPLQTIEQSERGNILTMCAKMLAMIIAGASVYSFYIGEKNLKEENGWHRDSLHEKKNKGDKKLLWKDGGLIMVAGVIISLFLNYLFAITGFTSSSEAYNQVAQSQFSYALFPALLFYGVVSPVVEELVFRGIVYSSLKRNLTVIPAIVGSTLLFGAIHGNIVQMLYGTLMGSVMAILYEKYGKLLAPILFHGAANVAIYIYSYLIF